MLLPFFFFYLLSLAGCSLFLASFSLYTVGDFRGAWKDISTGGFRTQLLYDTYRPRLSTAGAFSFGGPGIVEFGAEFFRLPATVLELFGVVMVARKQSRLLQPGVRNLVKI